MSERRIALVLGTRPEIVKLAGVARLLGERSYLVHSGQHYDDLMSQAFFDSYRLPEPAYRLAVGGRDRAAQFAGIVGDLGQHLRAEHPVAVVVQGDTNTAAAGALAATCVGIPVVHVEAGLRSYDRTMPEEINRQLVGVLATLHCAPTETSACNLLSEGVPTDRIVITGNTVVEAVEEMLPEPARRAQLLADRELLSEEYVLVTIHRPENVDDPERLRSILTALAEIDLPVLMPIHPRTRDRIAEFGLGDLLAPLRVIDPLDHPSFLGLARHARLLVSDSGGLQEECTVLKRPLLVVRNSTERPESVEAGFARRAVPGPGLAEQMVRAAERGWLEAVAHLPSPYGDGSASERIVRAIDDLSLYEGSPDRLVGGQLCAR